MKKIISYVAKPSLLTILGLSLTLSALSATSAEARRNRNRTQTTTQTQTQTGTTFNKIDIGSFSDAYLGSLDSFNFSLSEFTGDDTQVDITLYDIGTDILFDVDVASGTTADITGIYFDIKQDLFGGNFNYADFEIAGPQVTQVANNTKDLSNGSSLKGGDGDLKPDDFDFAAKIGSSGGLKGGSDDWASTMFTLSHNSFDLGLDMFRDEEFGTRLKSVGADREGSSKLSRSAYEAQQTTQTPETQPETQTPETQTPTTQTPTTQTPTTQTPETQTPTTQNSNKKVIAAWDAWQYQGANSTENHAFWFNGLLGEGLAASDKFLFTEAAEFLQYDDGTASLTGTVVNNTDADQIWDVDVKFDMLPDYAGGTKNGGLKEDLESLDPLDIWSFYELADGSVLTGKGDYEGSELKLFNRAFEEANYADFLETGKDPKVVGQLGYGANDKNTDMGFSYWYGYTGEVKYKDDQGNISSHLFDANASKGLTKSDMNLTLIAKEIPEEIPEPGSLAGLGLVAGGLVMSRRRKSKKIVL